jgi:hypothetical protein
MLIYYSIEQERTFELIPVWYPGIEKLYNSNSIFYPLNNPQVINTYSVNLLDLFERLFMASGYLQFKGIFFVVIDCEKMYFVYN